VQPYAAHAWPRWPLSLRLLARELGIRELELLAAAGAGGVSSPGAPLRGRLCICVGAGGVGKTTVAAAIACLRAAGANAWPSSRSIRPRGSRRRSVSTS